MKKLEELNKDKADDILHSAQLLSRHGNIKVSFLKEDDDSVCIRAIQGKNFSGNYLTQKELIHLIKDTFGKYTDKHVKVHAQAYQHPPVDVVNSEWMRSQMSKFKISNKEIVKDTGFEKSDVSNLLRGNKPMSQRTKAAFYYYILAKKNKLDLKI